MADELPECPVCLDTIDPSVMCRTTCGHAFHSECAFRAMKADPASRCSVCRTRLVPEVAASPPKAREITIEVDGVDFQEFSSRIQRSRRNYNARRRRLEQRDGGILALRNDWKDACKDLGQCDRQLDKLYAEEVRNLYQKPEVRALRANRLRACRREQRLKRQYQERLQSEIGAEPGSPLEQLLMQQVNLSDELLGDE